MPKEGLSDTGQLVVAIATAVILALLAKFGLTPNESEDEGGKGNGPNNGPINVPNIIINVNPNGAAEREASQGKADARPRNEPPSPGPPLPPTPGLPLPGPPTPRPPPLPAPPTPGLPTPAPSPVRQRKRWDDLKVGSLPIQMRQRPIMDNLMNLRRLNSNTTTVVIVLDQSYHVDVKIAVWASGMGFDPSQPYAYNWRIVEQAWIVPRAGDSEMHWVAHFPTTTKRFVVLCRTDDATEWVDDSDAYQYCAHAEKVKDGQVRYIVTDTDELITFDNSGTNRLKGARLSDGNVDGMEPFLPAIYIPLRRELHKTPEKI